MAVKMPMPAEGRLYLTRIDEAYDPAHDAALGPWCFVGCEGIFSAWDEQTFSPAFGDSEALAAAALKARQLTDHWVARLAPRLNERHGTTFSPRFWRYLTVAWISNLIQISWARYVHIDNFVRAHAHRRFKTTVVTGDPGWRFATTSAFVDFATFEPAFHNWLNSTILAALAPSSWELAPLAEQSAPPPADSRIVGLQVRTSIVKKVARAFIGRLLFDRVSGVGAARIAFSAYLRLLPKRVKSDAPVFARVNCDPSTDFPEPYLAILERMIEMTMPASFGNGFRNYYEAATTHRFVAGRLCVTSHSYDEPQKFIDACAKEAGERLICTQHGGAYGTARSAGMVQATEYEHTALFTWGWTAQQDSTGHFVPLPSPYLSRYANRHRAEDDTLILVAPAARVQLQRLDASPQPHQIVAGRKHRLEFFMELRTDILARAFYRPYLRDQQLLEDCDYIQNRLPAVQILNGDLHQAILKCRLLVLDHQSTTLNIALAANIPTIAFWDLDSWALSHEAKPFFERLEAVGILFQDPVRAAERANEVWDDVDSWWRRRDVQDARRVWCHQFARTSRIWWWHWAKALARVAADGAPA